MVSARPAALALALALAGCAQEGLDVPEPPPELDQAYFACNVQPVLATRCAFFACHGSATRPFRVYARNRLRFDVDPAGRELPLTAVEERLNYDSARGFAGDPRRPALLLLKPLEERAGGFIHVGATLYGRGDVFLTTDDPGYQKLAAWVAGATAPEDCAVSEEVGP